MYERKSVAVVPPAYNEEKLVTETVRGIPAFVDRILFVDDSSRDGLQLLLFAMWFDMESNEGLTSGTQSGRLELPAGARVVLVYEGTRDGALEAAAATTAAAAGSAREN